QLKKKWGIVYSLFLLMNPVIYRGKGYDGASNMRGEFNGLQKLIRDENPFAFYVHCFAHQLQLIVDLFDTCASCKIKDILQHKHHLNLLSNAVETTIYIIRNWEEKSMIARWFGYRPAGATPLSLFLKTL
ncbi:hypothetical protein ACJX0J_007127, partial [Zea mays]